MDGITVVAAGGIALGSVLAREIGLSVSALEIGVSAVLISNTASDAALLIILLDEDGNPLLDINGQYIIGG